MSNHADARPAFGFHLVEVFEASEIGSGIGSSGFSSFFANGVGGANVINTGDLKGLGALLGMSEEGQKGEKNNHKH